MWSRWDIENFIHNPLRPRCCLFRYPRSGGLGIPCLFLQSLEMDTGAERAGSVHRHPPSIFTEHLHSSSWCGKPIPYSMLSMFASISPCGKGKKSFLPPSPAKSLHSGAAGKVWKCWNQNPAICRGLSSASEEGHVCLWVWRTRLVTCSLVHSFYCLLS